MRFSLALVGLLAFLFCGCVADPSDRSSANDFERAGKDPPITANTHFAAGRLAEVQNDIPRAIHQYQEALKLDPRHSDSLYRLAIDYAALKNFPDAVTTWKTYILVTNGAAAGWSNLGFTYELAGQLTDAEASYRHGIIQDPHDTGCRVNFGLFLARQGHVADAVQQLSAVLTPAEAHYDVASVYEQQGHKDQARAEYQKALQLDPAFTDASARLAELH